MFAKFAGLVFEAAIKRLANQYFPDSFHDFIYYEPTLKLSGFAIDDGYQPPQWEFQGTPMSNTSRPDFIITSGHPRRHTADGDRSWLIGDIKLSLKTLVTDYFGFNGQSPTKQHQWTAIHKYARKNATYLAGFITLFDGGKQNKQVLRSILNREAASKGITGLVASILQNATKSSNW